MGAIFRDLGILAVVPRWARAGWIGSIDRREIIYRAPSRASYLLGCLLLSRRGY